jgi:3-dehydroquinate dehydratase-2
MNVLVVHGPNLNLLGEAKGDPVTFAELNVRLEAFARELGVTLKVIQSNGEGALLDAIQAERTWADAILINPAALTHTSYALRECLRIAGRPAVEVHLEDIRRRETWRRKSVIKDVCQAQVMGKGLLSYLDGLERLATGKYGGLRTGRAKAAALKASSGAASDKAAANPSAAPTPAPAPKTLGRATAVAQPAALLKEAAFASAPAAVVKTLGKEAGGGAGRSAGLVKAGISRTAVRERIAARLGRKISPSALATWAREQWLNVERGAATEMGHRELLEEALQTLALSATPAGQMTETELIELMARLA